MCMTHLDEQELAQYVDALVLNKQDQLPEQNRGGFLFDLFNFSERLHFLFRVNIPKVCDYIIMFTLWIMRIV